MRDWMTLFCCYYLQALALVCDWFLSEVHVLAVRVADERSRAETERICMTSLPTVAVGAGDASLTDTKDVTSAQLSVVSRLKIS